MTSILDKEFKYTPSTKTDIRKTFAKARKAMQEAKALPLPAAAPIMLQYVKRVAK